MGISQISKYKNKVRDQTQNTKFYRKENGKENRINGRLKLQGACQKTIQSRPSYFQWKICLGYRGMVVSVQILMIILLGYKYLELLGIALFKHGLWLAYAVQNIVLKCLRRIIIQSTGYQHNKKMKKGKAQGKKSKSRRKTTEGKNPAYEMENQSQTPLPNVRKIISLILFTHSFHCLRILFEEFANLLCFYSFVPRSSKAFKNIKYV